MKVAELEGAQLDYWVARAEGKAVYVDPNSPRGTLFYDDDESATGRFIWMPSNDWAQGGPIIEREEISLLPGPWSAQVFLEDGLRSFEGMGRTPLVAAMRAYVASKFGDEVHDS